MNLKMISFLGYFVPEPDYDTTDDVIQVGIGGE